MLLPQRPGAQIKLCSKGAWEKAQTGGCLRPTPHLPTAILCCGRSPHCPPSRGGGPRTISEPQGCGGSELEGATLPREAQGSSAGLGYWAGDAQAPLGWTVGSVKGHRPQPGQMGNGPRTPGRGVARGSTPGPWGLQAMFSKKPSRKGRCCRIWNPGRLWGAAAGGWTCAPHSPLPWGAEGALGQGSCWDGVEAPGLQPAPLWPSLAL